MRRVRTGFLTVLCLITACTPAADHVTRAYQSNPTDHVYHDADGQPYQVRALDKSTVQYRITKNGRVRVDTYYNYPLAAEDERFLYVKSYLPAPRSQPVKAPPVIEQVTPETSTKMHFETFGKGLPRSGQWRQGFDIADMNGDGYADIVHGPARQGRAQMNIWLGDGLGNWRKWPELTIDGDASLGYGAVAVIDFNTDGLPDIAIAVHLGAIQLLQNRGGGRFTPGTVLEPADTSFSSRAITVTDWDGDGRDDLLALSEGPRPGVTPVAAELGWVAYLNKGEEWSRLAQSSASRSMGDSITSGDFNGDGLTDIATASMVQGEHHLIYVGTQTGDKRPAPALSLPANAFVEAVVAADFDGDRVDELLVGVFIPGSQSIGQIIMVKFHTDGTLYQRTLISKQGARYTAMDAGDLDGDGNNDIVALTDDAGVLVLIGNGQGMFKLDAGPNAGSSLEGCHGYHVRMVDLDNDGRGEIISAFADAGRPGCAGGGYAAAWRPADRHDK